MTSLSFFDCYWGKQYNFYDNLNYCLLLVVMMTQGQGGHIDFLGPIINSAKWRRFSKICAKISVVGFFIYDPELIQNKYLQYFPPCFLVIIMLKKIAISCHTLRVRRQNDHQCRPLRMFSASDCPCHDHPSSSCHSSNSGRIPGVVSGHTKTIDQYS